MQHGILDYSDLGSDHFLKATVPHRVLKKIFNSATSAILRADMRHQVPPPTMVKDPIIIQNKYIRLSYFRVVSPLTNLSKLESKTWLKEFRGIQDDYRLNTGFSVPVRTSLEFSSL